MFGRTVGVEEKVPGKPDVSLVALFGHPGHELLVAQMLQDNAATVFWITDGSGGSNSDRNAYTRQFLEAADCYCDPCSGKMDDRALYSAILSNEPALMDDVIEKLTSALTQSGGTVLLTDPMEYFNPAHDLANTIADIAIVKAGRAGVAVTKRVYANEYPEKFDPADAVSNRNLDAAELAFKMLQLENYVPLFAEWKRLEHAGKLSDMSTERLFADDIRLGDIPEPSKTRFASAFYETYGRNAVARGLYSTCITFADHVLPFARSLVERHLGASAPR
jgi:hypothetical protein